MAIKFFMEDPIWKRRRREIEIFRKMFEIVRAVPGFHSHARAVAP
jgi:hypothetical protein